MLPTYNELKCSGFDARKHTIPFLIPAPPYLFHHADPSYTVLVVYFSIIPNDHRLICAWPSVLMIRDLIMVEAIDQLM